MNISSNPRLVNNERYVGMIIYQKSMKSTTIHSVLRVAWERYDSVTICDAYEKVVLYEFEDRKKIFDMLPWSIQGHCLSMRKWMPSVGLAHIEFKWVQFWVQVHDLRVEKFSFENAKVIGEQIGRFIESEKEVENVQKTFVILKVEVNVEEQLMTGFWWVNS